LAPGQGFEPWGPNGPHALKAPNLDETLERFKQFCIVDLSLSEATAEDHHVPEIKRFFGWLGDREVSTDAIRDYLAEFKDLSASTRANVLKAFRRFFRDYLGRGDLVATFKLPHQNFRPKSIPTREELQQFYAALKSLRDRAIFLMYATTGLRRHELVSLTLKEIDFDKRMILPGRDDSRTKRVWATFYNEEVAEALRKYLGTRGNDPDLRLFPIGMERVDRIFKRASEASGVRITPQVLRDWFCSEMAERGVADRYVDAFCGRVPRSVLARHYTDFSPERLKRIYDNANVRVFCKSVRPF